MKALGLMIVALSGAALSVTGCSSGRSEWTYYPQVPHTAKCAPNIPNPTTTDHRALPADPTGASLIWFTGLGVPTRSGQGPACRVYNTRLNGDQAAALAADLRALKDPNIGSGSISCPADFGDFVQVEFLSSSAPVSYRIGLSGCTFTEPDPKALGAWPLAMRSTG